MIHTVGIGQFALEVIIRNGLLAGMIYTNLFLLIPDFTRKKIQYSVLLLLTIAAYVILKSLHDVYLNGYILGDENRRSLFYNSYYNFSIAFFYLTFSIALFLSKAWYFQRELIRKMQIEKLSAELEYLKAQINPHFIFNSINAIYFQIDKRNTHARESLFAFSDMLRYQLYECNGNQIPIEKEIVYLKNYVELQRMRKDENYNISLIVDEDLKGFNISPLLLIPFVENAFKHISHNPSHNQVRIAIGRHHDNFKLSVFNTKEMTPSQQGRIGVGLKNVRRRLELLYKDRHTLNIENTADSYEVNLSLQINRAFKIASP
jgi:LytS/YehU family sensor histidine kinase